MSRGSEKSLSQTDLAAIPEVYARRKAICGESYDPEADTEALPPPAPKSPETRAKLMQMTNNNFVFIGLDDRQKELIVDHLSERPVRAGEVIVKQGDKGEYFYVVDSGKFNATIDGKQVNSYENSGSFGELALYYDQVRAATITAATDGKLWQIDRTLFRRVVLRKAVELRKGYEALLKSVPMLESLTARERLILCDALIPRLYNDKDVIVKQGDQADGMYFVEQGEVIVQVKPKDGKEEQVTVLQRGNYFGELALLAKKPRAATVTAKGNVRTAFLPVSTFERLLGKCVDVMRRNVPHYEEQLVKIFGSKDAIVELR